MKELSIEQKAKAYDKAIEKAKEYFNSPRTCFDIEQLCNIFPELKESESEDEKIRKRIIHALHGDVLDIEETNKAIAWLEEQGKQKLQGKSALEAAKEEKVDNQNCVKPTYKNEPKFKVGDWVVRDNTTAQILDIQEQYYIGLDIDGDDFTSSKFLSDDKIHLWTIADAKPGDVLAYRGEQWIFIYKERRKDETLIEYYALVSERGLTINNVALTVLLSGVVPATKEQRDTLMKVMTDNGYTFDFDKKELKKIEENTAWSEDDDRMLDSIIEEVRYIDFPTNELYDEFLAKKEEVEWLKCLKERVQPKQEWSEEDLNILNAITYTVRNSGYKYCIGVSNEEMVAWLKSLRPQNRWKPSTFHLECVEDAIAMYKEHGINAIGLKDILEELKKLREE